MNVFLSIRYNYKAADKCPFVNLCKQRDRISFEQRSLDYVAENLMRTAKKLVEFLIRNVVMGAANTTTRVVLFVIYVVLSNCEPCHRPVNLPLANLKVRQAETLVSILLRPLNVII